MERESNTISSCALRVMWKLPLDENQLTQDFIVGKQYEFMLEGNASLPVQIPIDIVDGQGRVYGQVRVKEYQAGSEQTRGIFEFVSRAH